MRKQLWSVGLGVLGLLPVTFTNSVRAQNFTLTMQPSGATLNPGESASFVVKLTPINGFNAQVTLTNLPLTNGFITSFTPPQLTPPGESILNITAPSNATAGSFDLEISAGGGGVTNTTSSSVMVSFGLLPECFGAFGGEVTDAQSGLPISNATVTAIYAYYYYSPPTGTNGTYVITNLALGSPDNSPVDYSLYATAPGYWQSAYTNAYAICDATNGVNWQLLRMETGSISGVVFYEGGALATGVLVSVSGPTQTFTTTSTNGTFQISGLDLYNDNANAPYTVYSDPEGYWEAATNTYVGADSNSLVTLTLIPECYGTVTGTVLLANSGLPATNALVTIGDGVYPYEIYATTDTSGKYIVTNVYLDFNNMPFAPGVTASYSGYYTAYTNQSIQLTCGGTVGMPTLQLQPIPVIITTNNYGAITGQVTDAVSGQPIAGALVEIPYQYLYGYTDTNGNYFITNVLVGTDGNTNGSVSAYASASRYWQSQYSNVLVYAGQISTQNFQEVLVGYGYLAGTVLDSASQQPVDNASVNYGAYGVTGTNGQYASGPQELNYDNSPATDYFFVSANGYWSLYTNTTFNSGITNILNVDLIKVCTGATVVGNVIDAVTQQPITNATVYTYNSLNNYLASNTDTNGNFIITNITVGNDNEPFATTVTASAPGFYSQTKNITVFCGATISTVFGATETVFGAIDGYVTNVITGLPLTNVFVGTGFGAATNTDTNGYYLFTQVPLGANDSPITWTVSAIPTDYPEQSKSVTVHSNVTSELDFGFGLESNRLALTATGTPNPVLVGSNLLYLVTLTNAVADALDVTLSNVLPANVTYLSATLTNSPGTPFSAPVFSNNVVTTSASDMPSNSAVQLAILVTTTASGTLTNVASVSSISPDLDPTGSNHTAKVLTTVTSPESPQPPLLVVSVGAPANPVPQGSSFVFLVELTNAVSSAQNVTISDTLPSGVTFVSAEFTNSPGTPFSDPVFSDGVVSSSAAEMASNTAVEIAIVAIANSTGTLTDTVNVNTTTESLSESSVLEAETNVVSVSSTNVSSGLEVEAGEITFNPQTGLFQQPVTVVNVGSGEDEDGPIAAPQAGGPVPGVVLIVSGLPSGVGLYNARGTTNGQPYVEYDQTLDVDDSVTFLLEYYEATRASFDSTNFVALAATPSPPTVPAGTVVPLDRAPFISEGQVTIEFMSVPGDTYVVQYSANTTPAQWQTAVPPIVANANETEWVDSGPPKTATSPGALGERIYQVLLVATDSKANASAALKPFYPVRGVYCGLICDSNSLANETLGAITLLATAEGQYSGKLQIGSRTASVDGRFDANGVAVRGLALNSKQPLLLQMQVDLTGAGGLSGIVSDGIWTAVITATRAFSDAPTPCPFAGAYKVAGTKAEADSVPVAYGNVKVDRDGRVTFSGALPDGTRLTQASSLSAAGDWPLYNSLYDHQGCIAGWLRFTNSSGTAGGGLVTWIKPSSFGTPAYPGGFINQLPLSLIKDSAADKSRH